MRIAVIEASHWHVPLYLEALEAAPAARVTAVSDLTRTSGPSIAARFGARHYRDWRQLVRDEDLDFAFVFGRHEDMPAIATCLIECGVPFAIEKPAGLCAAQVEEIQRHAAASGHFVAVPLIFGFSDLMRHLPTAASEPGDWRHMSFRFLAGPVSRYLDAHCDWMLDRKTAGGGCTINLAVHFIDIVQRLTGSPIRAVSARMIRERSEADVEIYSVLTMQTAAGQLCTIETGYTYPGGTREQREFTFSLASAQSYVQSTQGGLAITPRGTAGRMEIPLDLNTDVYYGEFVLRSLRDVREGRKPPAGLSEMASIMRVIDCAYESDRSDGKVVHLAGQGGGTAPS